MQIPSPTSAISGKARSFAVLGLLALAGSCGGNDATFSASLVHTVGRSDLHITVRERAELQAETDTRVVSKLEGRNTLIHLIPEGSVVARGQKLAELDASQIEEKRANQAILVAKADATLKQARKNFEVMEKELLAAERTAQSRLQIARIRVSKFLGQARVQQLTEQKPASGTNREMVDGLRALIASDGFDKVIVDARPEEMVERVLELLDAEQAENLEMGEMANQILTQIDEIGLARADFALAADTLRYSENLAENSYITRNELQRDEINFKRQQSRVTVAWNNLQLLIKFTLRESLIALKQEADNAQLGLESVRAANEARRVQQEAELISAEAEFKLAKERLDNWNQQIKNAVLFAPSEGLVVYGRYDWDEPVYEGMEVRERQDIIILPDIRRMVAELKVHEAQIDKVGAGQTATIKIDAFPEQTFVGHVAKVSTLPDPSRRSNEVKVYTVMVALDRENTAGEIRPGMNSTVEIEVGVLANVLTVPLPALERSGDRHYVWRITPAGPVATQVTLGGNNLTHVEIVAGLEENDRILLIRPSGAQLPEDDAQPTPPEPAPDDEGEPAAAVDDAGSANAAEANGTGANHESEAAPSSNGG